MFWFNNKGNPIYMETNTLENLRVQTVFDQGFFLYQKERDLNVHRHLNHELYFIEEGTVELLCEEELFSCTENDIFFIPAGKAHNVQTLSKDASLYSLRFSLSKDASLPSPSQTCHGKDFCCAPAKSPALQSPQLFPDKKELSVYIHRIRAELYLQNLFASDMIQGLLQIFYGDLLRLLLNPSGMPRLPQHFSIAFDYQNPECINGYRSDIPQEFYIDLMDEYFTHFYQKSPSLQNLADQLHLSISQTQRLLKNHYGLSFREKLTQTRIDAAKHLMSTTTLSMEAIAEQIGYSSYNGFFEAFCNHMGMTPSQYRQITGEGR